VSTPTAALPVHPALWRGEECAPTTQTVPTGFAPLDRCLPGGGWPQGALTEIASAVSGIGELRLLMPACARLTRAGRWVVFVAPPWIPYAPALAAAGLDPGRLLLVRTGERRERLWAFEQALQSRSCGAALAWPEAADERSLRRLQLACERGGSMGILFVPEQATRNASPAALRLRLAPTDDGALEVRIHKRRGSTVAMPLHLRP
jgi:hypothetical protein